MLLWTFDRWFWTNVYLDQFSHTQQDLLVFYPKFLQKLFGKNLQSRIDEITLSKFENAFNRKFFLLLQSLWLLLPEALVQRCSLKKMFWKISQNSQENNNNKVADLRPVTLLKRDSSEVFLCEFYLFCRTSVNGCFCSTS